MADHIIIGGGAIGLSLAYHLARDGQTGVLLLERNRLTSGTSWHAAGIVGPLRATMHMTRLAMRALELFPALEQETGLSTGYRRTGGCWLAREPARMDELQRIAAIGRVAGLTPEIITPGEVKIPGLNTDGLIGALRVDEDASVNPVDLCMAYAKAARARGAVIRENTPVARVIVQDRQAVGVALTDGTELSANTVSICTGAWSRALTEPLGVTLPLQPVEHMYVVTEPIPGLPDPFPVLRDLDQGIYVKGDAGKLVIGGFERDAKPWDAFGPEGDRPFLELPEDWTQFTPFMEAALALIPTLEHTGIQHFMNGPESFTNDTRPLIGETPEVAGLFVAAGMNSVGVMSSAGIGRLLADWIVAGAAPHDVWEVDIRRADPLTSGSVHMKSRMKEAVSDAFALHWPYKQPKAGRNLRRSALHDQWAADGAVFGLTAGWERALWYAHDTAERDLPYCVGAQPWQPIADREAQAMAAGGALLDLSPFTKIEVTGPQALPLLQHLCTSNINTKTGAVTYTQMLNPRGGIEADVTITRHAADSFRITSGAATRWKDLAWIRRHASEYTIEINDKTETEAVIGVMGPQSRAVLSSLSDTDWKIFPFASARPATIAGQSITATRVSFVGELGWELAIPATAATTLYAALRSAGATPMGHYALDGCRIEKAYKHWGHDLGPDISPLEAGLGFTIDWGKPDFIGKSALAAQNTTGTTRRLILFDLPGHPLILHDEPIWEGGTFVGLTTSGGKGPRTGKTLAFGLIRTGARETLAQTCARRFEIEVAGHRYPAKPLANPPYDPAGERMRA